MQVGGTVCRVLVYTVCTYVRTYIHESFTEFDPSRVTKPLAKFTMFEKIGENTKKTNYNKAE